MQYGLTCINRFKTYNAYLIPWVQNWKINYFIRLCSFLYTRTLLLCTANIPWGFFDKTRLFSSFCIYWTTDVYWKRWKMVGWLFFWDLLTYTCFKSSLRSEMTFQMTFLSSSHTYMQLLFVYLFMKQYLNASLMVRSSFMQAWI